MKKFFLFMIILCVTIGGLLYFYYTKARQDYVGIDQCQCLGLVKDGLNNQKMCWGLIYKCPENASFKNYLTDKFGSIRDRIKNVSQNNKKYTIQNIDLSNNSEYFRAGIYYKYVGQNNKLNSLDIDIDLVLNALMNSNIPVEELWYKNYSSSCCPPIATQDQSCMQAIVAPVFIVRTSQDVDLEKYGFHKVVSPDIGWCAYSVTHYIINQKSKDASTVPAGKFDYQSYLAKYGNYSCYQYTKLDSQLCQLMQIYSSSEYTPQEKEDYYLHYYTDDTPRESLKNGLVKTTIELNDSNYDLPEKFGSQNTKYQDSIFAHVSIDRLVELSNQPAVRYVRQPLTPASQ